MPLKRSPAATVYEVGLTREKKGEGGAERERKNLEKGKLSKQLPVGEGGGGGKSHVLSA